jgi:thiol-disulfide isomerase/thioredoxin
MKYTFLLLSLLLASTANDVSAQTKKGWVTLTGTTRNFNNQEEVQDMSEMSNLKLPDPQRFFVPDSLGRFTIKFSLGSPNYFRIGRNILYLSPGDKLTVFIDYKNPKLASFTGTHSKENEYLRETPFPKGGSFLDAGDQIRSTVDSTVMAIEEAAQKRTQSLSSYTGLSKEFIRLETARIKADILNSFSNIYTYFVYEHKLQKDSADAFRKGFSTAIAPYMNKYDQNFIDPSLLKLVVYRDVVDELVAKEKNGSQSLQSVKDWMTAKDLAAQLKKASDRETKMGFESKINAIPNLAYRTALKNTLTQTLQLSNGDIAADFTALDQNSHSVKLNSLKGKLIYVDLWATWCGPCLEEMPAYEKLKESYKDNPNISFISLSIDDDKDAWKKNMQKRNAQGLQWIIDRAKLQSYNIIGIPRSILIDQDFHIVEMNAALPSSKTITNTLNELLK